MIITECSTHPRTDAAKLYIAMLDNAGHFCYILFVDVLIFIGFNFIIVIDTPLHPRRSDNTNIIDHIVYYMRFSVNS